MTVESNPQWRASAGRWTIIIAVLNVVLFFGSMMPALGQRLTGTVRSTSGQPIAGVSVFTQRDSRVQTKTDNNGLFFLPTHGRVIFFRHQDFKPLSKVLQMSQTSLDVILETKDHSEWIVPPCNSVESVGKKVKGIGSQFIVPKGVRVRKVQDVDYVLYVISENGPKRARKDSLQIWFGPNVSNEFPPENLLLDSNEFSERWWVSRSATGVDLRGRLVGELHWRWTSLPLGFAEYRTSSEKLASLFDKIIDGMCYEMP